MAFNTSMLQGFFCRSLCCSNYFYENGECKVCLPGYFGIKCSSRCFYPNYGPQCQNTCNCTVTDCNHVDGCQGNRSEKETTTELKINTKNFKNSPPLKPTSFHRPSTEKVSNLADNAIIVHSQEYVSFDSLPCCTNYFWENGKCKVCLPGYFGMNCSSLCAYPHYGKTCLSTCDCTVTDCNHVLGCLGNHSQNETSTGSADFKLISSVTTWSAISSTGDKTNKHSKNKKKLGNDNSTLAIILVGCVLLMLIVVTGVSWISKSIRRNCTNIANTEDNDRIETVYLEINAGSEQQESEPNTIGATVITRSYTSLDGVETRPELPARNNLDQKTNTTNAYKDNETCTHTNVQN